MSFERFDTSTVTWGEPGHQPSITLPDAVDSRIQAVRIAIDALEHQPQPTGLSEARWFELLEDMRHVSDQWLDLALACGWSLLDLFGSAPTVNGQVRLMGAAVLLKGRQIDSIDADRIVIGNRIGAPNVFYRQAPGMSAPFDRRGSKLIWDVIGEGAAQ